MYIFDYIICDIISLHTIHELKLLLLIGQSVNQLFLIFNKFNKKYELSLRSDYFRFYYSLNIKNTVCFSTKHFTKE